jgi:hypothetical protein
MNLQELLASLGAPEAGTWAETAPGAREEPETIRRQKELLAKLAELIEAQIGRDTATVAELREKVNRLKHGGGV